MNKMSKEIEEMIENLKCAYNSNYEMSEHLSDTEFNNIINALTEYEAIKNAEPSEALECWNNMQSRIASYISTIEYYTIKQALLKAQEPKHYLKWEDLEFKHKPEYINVKMGDNKYLLIVGFSDGGNEMAILQTKLRRYYFIESEDNKTFFNDLHLERVE